MKKVKARAISGIPEWLPEVRRIEVQWMDRIREVYESFGYLPIETSAMELLEVLESKGEIDKEIYIVTKPHENAKAEFGLHYDLTVPLARYVAQNFGQLSFPFRRYQMQKIWRGERPQKGRFREFYQCDIDVVDRDKLGLFFDFEVLYAGHKAMSALDIPEFFIGVSNRKLYEGYLEGIGITATTPVLRIIDKMDKIGQEGVAKLLVDQLGIDLAQVEKALLPASISSKDLSFVDDFKALGVVNEKAETGLSELQEVIASVEAAGGANVKADLSFVRGFDYYTGTIFEGKFAENPQFGSICSGGRYDNLAARFSNYHLPGVGFSIGLSRIFSILYEDGKLDLNQDRPVDALIARTSDDDLPKVMQMATRLRENGYNTEVYGYQASLGKQFKYATKKGIKHVFLPSRENPEHYEVKNLESGEQEKVGEGDWKTGKNE